MKARRIFRQFILRYILFLVITIILVAVTIVFAGILMQQSFDENFELSITARSIKKDNPEDMKMSQILNSDGWVQVLDHNFNVVFSKGQNAPEKYRYTEEKIIELLGEPLENKYFCTADYYPPGSKYSMVLVGLPSKSIRINLEPGETAPELSTPLYSVLIKSGLLFLLLMILNILLYSYFTARKLSNPLAVLLNGIQSMSKREKGIHVDIRTGNELEDIAAAFNKMVEELDEARANKERLEKARKQLLLDISHDLKTPLTSIRGYVEALADDLVDDAETRTRYYQIIQEKTVKVNSMIEELFELTKLESTDYIINMEKKDIVEFIRRWLAVHLDEIEGAGFGYNVELPDERIDVMIDENLLERAVTNILNNAVKYNPAGTELTIRIAIARSEFEDNSAEAHTFCRLIIADNGIGIKEELLPTIFEPFVRGDSSRSSTGGGTGLGLAIARQIILKHNGDISLESKEGEGSKYVIDLPLG